MPAIAAGVSLGLTTFRLSSAFTCFVRRQPKLEGCKRLDAVAIQGLVFSSVTYFLKSIE
jgi:hypothetical protein